MKTLKLNEYGVKELSKTEFTNIEGGWLHWLLHTLLHCESTDPNEDYEIFQRNYQEALDELNRTSPDGFLWDGLDQGPNGAC